MKIVVEAICENGVFRPFGPVDLPEKTRVQLLIEPLPQPPQDDDPRGESPRRS